MKISTKGRYALRMLSDLAVHQNEGFISLKNECATIEMREGLYKIISEYLDGITIQNISDKSMSITGDH